MNTDASSGVPPSMIDQRPRQLLEKYASLAGALLMEVADGVLEFEVPEKERSYWQGVRVVRVALLPEALEEDPAAELLGIGSPVFERLLSAIRARGCFESAGLLPPSADPAAGAAEIPVPLDGASAGEARISLTLLPVGRLLARVSINAGPELKERLIESPLIDLSNGAPLSSGDSAAFVARQSQAGTLPTSNVSIAPRRDTSELVSLLFDELERGLEADIARVRAEAALAMGAELDRLDRYYTAMIGEVEPGDDPDEAKSAKRAFGAELVRRRAEEERRYQVRVTVHPLQLTEWHILAQQLTWPLVSAAGRQANISATRLLIGEMGWRVTCPSCGAEPIAIRVCSAEHASCPQCSERCGVCGDTICRSHGLTTCETEGHPVCPSHARTCGSCGGLHCSTHSGMCAVGDHQVCPSCAVKCGRCGIDLCRRHGTETPDGSPKGHRWLCSGCTVLCEGGSNEPVGLDEVVRCTSCDRHICSVHQVSCAVDGAIHCSRHLRRSDRGGRLACEAHRATCADEPGSILASDEVAECATCQRTVCESHGGTCVADGVRHCISHLQALHDLPGRSGCELHRTTCHVDQVSYSVAGTRACAVCGKATCGAHLAACASCARHACSRDMENGKCRTCNDLQITNDPSDDLIQAALAANGGDPPKAKTWRIGRDATGTVVDLDLGWTRRVVFSVLHGDVKPKTVLQHSLLGTKRLR